MGTQYPNPMRVLDEWSFGPTVLMWCELNPRSGPPDVYIEKELETGEACIRPILDDIADDWKPLQQEADFLLFLSSSEGDILEKYDDCTYDDALEMAERFWKEFEPLGEGPAPKLDAANASGQERKSTAKIVKLYPVLGNDFGRKAASQRGKVRRSKTGTSVETPLPVDRLVVVFKFRAGRTVTTPGALKLLTSKEITKALARHRRGDWGDVTPGHWQENEESLDEGPLMSIYHAADDTSFWVITEADRSMTTVLLPEEY